MWPNLNSVLAVLVVMIIVGLSFDNSEALHSILHPLTLFAKLQSDFTLSQDNRRVFVMLSKFQISIEGILLPLASFFGITGNCVTIGVLSSPQIDLKPVFCSTLTMLAVFDSSFLLLSSLTFSLPLLSSFYEHQVLPFLLPFTLPAIQESFEIFVTLAERIT